MSSLTGICQFSLFLTSTNHWKTIHLMYVYFISLFVHTVHRALKFRKLDAKSWVGQKQNEIKVRTTNTHTRNAKRKRYVCVANDWRQLYVCQRHSWTWGLTRWNICVWVSVLQKWEVDTVYITIIVVWTKRQKCA